MFELRILPEVRLGEPESGRPLVDSIRESRLANMKELRPGSCGRSEVRILFVFDPSRNVVLLVAPGRR